MGLDLRLPLGLMFSLIGLILLGYGVLTWGSSQYALSLGINVNLAWGAVMLVFGATMFLMGWRSRKREASTPDARGGDVPHRHSH
jgi:hypothetical protein